MNYMTVAASEIAEIGQDCSVFIDSTRQERRCHNSHQGVVAAISLGIGKRLAVEILSNVCEGCKR